MSKFRVIARKCASTAATAATFVASKVATLFSQGSNTVATLHGTLSWLVSHLKKPFNGLVCSNSSSTSPNFAQEIEHLRESVVISPSNYGADDVSPSNGSNDEASIYGYDEYDADDLERWEMALEDMYNDVGWPDEHPGEYPPGEMGDIPW